MLKLYNISRWQYDSRMSKKATCSVWAILLVITISSLYLAFNNPQNIEIAGANEALFMNQVPQCPDDTNISDRFVCLSNLADATNKETDVLANKLITQAPVRLKEITSTNTGPASFEYSGKDFLTDLPIQVGKAQKVKDDYINNVCNLASMKIYKGSGMDLEQNACRYYFTEKYLRILKSLESSLKVE